MKPLFDGPIPGENYTSDTKNYPWHRPPEFSDLDDAIQFAADQLLDQITGFNVLTMLELGVEVSTVVDMFLTNGIGSGKWTPDMALIMAGPVAHIIKLMADAYDVEYQMGYEDTRRPLTKSSFNQINKLNEPKAKKALSSIKEDVAEVVSEASETPPTKPAKSGGFGAKPTNVTE